MIDGTPGSGTARLFVAALLPPAVLDRLAAELPQPERAGVRYTTRDQWHLTLRFLGQAPVDQAVAALADVRAGRAEVRLGPATVRLGRRIVCLPVDGLAALAEAVGAATATVGRPLERRPFQGHLTLARLTEPAARPPVGHPFDASFGVDEVHLVRSRTRPTGAVYDVVATRSLADGPAATHG